MIEFPIFPTEEYIEEMMNLAFINEMVEQEEKQNEEYEDDTDEFI